MNMLVFTLMFAVMSSAWNLLGGFAGYPSLGHVAFFGIGAYARGAVVRHHPITSGYEPFWLLPLIGIAVGLVGLPIAALAMRTRADVFAIVTITLLFVVADAGVQPAWPDRRRAGRVDRGRAVSRRDVRAAVLLRAAACCSRSRWG